MEKKSEISKKGRAALIRKMLIRFAFFPHVLGVLFYFLKNDPKFLERRAKGKEKENLKGYKEYCQTTRYRLIPNIW